MKVFNRNVFSIIEEREKKAKRHREHSGMHESYLLSAIVEPVQPSGPNRDHDMSDLSELGFHWSRNTKMRIFKSRLWHVHFSGRINAFDQIKKYGSVPRSVTLSNGMKHIGLRMNRNAAVAELEQPEQGEKLSGGQLTQISTHWDMSVSRVSALQSGQSIESA